MLPVDDQVTAMFYWFLKFRRCPTCGRSWTVHQDTAEGNEAWEHLGQFIAKKVVEQQQQSEAAQSK